MRDKKRHFSNNLVLKGCYFELSISANIGTPRLRDESNTYISTLGSYNSQTNRSKNDDLVSVKHYGHAPLFFKMAFSQ